MFPNQLTGFYMMRTLVVKPIFGFPNPPDPQPSKLRLPPPHCGQWKSEFITHLHAHTHTPCRPTYTLHLHAFFLITSHFVTNQTKKHKILASVTLFQIFRGLEKFYSHLSHVCCVQKHAYTHRNIHTAQDSSIMPKHI